MSIRIHPICLEELTIKHSIGTMANKILYNCPSCDSIITGITVEDTSDLYFKVHEAYREENPKVVCEALGEIHNGRNDNQLRGDDYLRQQLSIYQKHLIK